MKEFTSIRGYSWNVVDYHKWSERQFMMKMSKHILFDKTTPIIAIGSCFAEEVVKYLHNKGYNINAHPNGLQYNTFTIRDHLDHLFGKKSPYADVTPVERNLGEYRHPYKKIPTSKTIDEAYNQSDARDKQAIKMWQEAKLIIITLGLTEVWRDSDSGLVEIEIPHPQIFKRGKYEFRKTFFGENFENMTQIYRTIRNFSSAPIVLTVSPIPLYVTFSNQDVTIANCESKSTLRAVASQFVSEHSDVFYFPSYEMVMYSMDPGVFMKSDGRHVSDKGVSLIMEYFLSVFTDCYSSPQEQLFNHRLVLSGVDSAKSHDVSFLQPIGRMLNKMLKPFGIAFKKV
ncbi:MAG: hypothetical protein GQF41_0487 [Candidatus Rifleibacterium amylolyticum]|nr:MAG: hypothetical protein GQF41_0487 [Candidatus Rifleibacterium amylolyticum]